MPFIIVFIVIVAIALLLIFMLAPGYAGRIKRVPFFGRNIAHRGLFKSDQSVPENSMKAFSRAAEAGYGIELDVQLSADGEVVVFHDDTLKRACGADERVDSRGYAELSELSLFGTEERIPLFSDVLGLIGGRVPLVVELKNGPRNRELCEKTLALLREYKGPACVESFSPFIIAWFRFHARGIMRGQLAQLPQGYVKAGMSKPVGVMLGNTMFNFLARPHFIAYRIGKKPVLISLIEAMGAMSVAWTAHDNTAEKYFDAVIFEYYLPKQKYK